jgi:DNA topoisomerase VI subunit B
VTWQRTTFVTERSTEYFHESSLRALIGHDKPLWPLTLIKELIDNALDACEAKDTAPEIAVAVEADAFTVADNGSGLPPETVTESLNYDTRISDKKWYVGPTRGQLGSALKTLWPACSVATGKRSVVEVTACGVHHTITAYSGEIKSHEQKPATVKNGTFIRVHWPEIAKRGERFIPAQNSVKV